MIARRTKNNRKKGILLKFSMYLYLVICLFAIVWLRAAVVNLEYELGELNKLRADLVRDSRMVVAQRSSFYSIKKIEGIAVKQLGMTLPERENVFFVERKRAAGPYRASMK